MSSAGAIVSYKLYNYNLNGLGQFGFDMCHGQLDSSQVILEDYQPCLNIIMGY